MNITMKFLGAGVLLILFIILGGYYGNSHKTAEQDSAVAPTSTLKKSDQDFKIALMIPATHPALDSICNGFIETISKPYKSACTIFNAQGNRMLMRSQAEEIVSADYDLICTVGAACSLMAQEVTNKKKKPIPIVFAAVNDPRKLQLNANNITGISEERYYKQQCELLFLLKQDIKSILLVYDPTQGAGLLEDKNELEKICASKKITFKTIEIDKTSTIHQKVAGMLEGIDVVFVLKDNTVVAGMETLAALCNRSNVTLFASDLDSCHKGAVLCYGVQEYDFGEEAALKAIQIIRDSIVPSHIPITSVQDYRIKINSKNLDFQNLKIDKNLLFLIKSGEMI